MKRKSFIVIISIAIIAIIGASSLYLFSSPGSRHLTGRESPQPVSVVVWLYNKELSSLFMHYKALNPHVNIEVRTFRSYEQLHNELTAAISAQNAPHIAEVNSLYGLVQLAHSGAVNALDDRLPGELWQQMNPNLPGYFEYQEARWAVPFGVSVAALYYNKKLLAYSGLKDITGLQEWRDLLRIDGESSTETKDKETRTNWGDRKSVV